MKTSNNVGGKPDQSPARLEAKAFISKLWAMGDSASLIAERINRDFEGRITPMTRNSVIGIVHRQRIQALRDGEPTVFHTSLVTRKKSKMSRNMNRASGESTKLKAEPFIAKLVADVPKGSSKEVVVVKPKKVLLVPLVRKNDVSRKLDVTFQETDDDGCRCIGDDGTYCNARRGLTPYGRPSSYCEFHERGMRQERVTKIRAPFEPVRRF